MINYLRLIKNKKLYRPTLLTRVVLDNCGIVGKHVAVEESLKNTFTWIKASFDATKDGGSSAYYIFGGGWKASYPETTGYLIPTMYEYAAYSGNKEWAVLAKKAADWLLKIQDAQGGWQGLQVDEKCDLRVFNSGMILDGLVAAYQRENDPKYLEAAARGMKWIAGKVGPDGFFKENNVVGGGAFDTLVCACMLMVIQYLPQEEQNIYIPIVRKALDAHLTLQTENAWFRKCNFRDDNLALLHHLGYTVDGLLISAEILDDKNYYAAAKRTLNKLLSKFEVSLELPAFTASDWTTHKDLGSKASLCLTGYSQISIAFQKVARIENDLRFLNAALKINDLVASIGNYPSMESGISYGLPGSYPINGSYQPYQFVNWAAKYHAEAMLLSLNKSNSKKKTG
jgi:uncharacterized protein YyaL (SSP411 family)